MFIAALLLHGYTIRWQRKCECVLNVCRTQVVNFVSIIIAQEPGRRVETHSNPDFHALVQCPPSGAEANS